VSARQKFDRGDWALLLVSCTIMMVAVLLHAPLWAATISPLIGLAISVVRGVHRFVSEHPELREK